MLLPDIVSYPQILDYKLERVFTNRHRYTSWTSGQGENLMVMGAIAYPVNELKARAFVIGRFYYYWPCLACK